jgi:hypothetical protein
MYLVLAVLVLPQWIVSLSPSAADANTQLNAVTNTRGTLIGILAPLVIVIGGIAAFRNYQEVRAQNIRTNALTLIDRDETRRVRRADVYAALMSACHDCWEAAIALHLADRESTDFLHRAEPERPSHFWYLQTNAEKSVAMDAAHDRVRLLGSDAVQVSALDLVLYCHAEIVLKAQAVPKLSDEEWQRSTGADYQRRRHTFLDAARTDLAPTR